MLKRRSAQLKKHKSPSYLHQLANNKRVAMHGGMMEQRAIKMVRNSYRLRTQLVQLFGNVLIILELH